MQLVMMSSDSCGKLTEVMYESALLICFIKQIQGHFQEEFIVPSRGVQNNNSIFQVEPQYGICIWQIFRNSKIFGVSYMLWGPF